MSIAYDKILLLVLGIVILVVAIYFYSIYISPQPTNCEICRNLVVSWCTHCNLTGYPNDNKIPSNICKCASECNLLPCSGTPSCRNLESNCMQFVTLI